jgi:hypothetical protein
MPDNPVFNNDPSKTVVQKTKSQLLSADPDTLSTSELERRAVLIDLEHKELNRELVKAQTEQLKMKQAQNRDKFYSRGLELKKTTADQNKQQAKCSHRKGGRGIEALISGGNAPDYCFLKHLLPHNEWYVRCMRCGKTYQPAHAEDYDLRTAEGREAFEKHKAEYKWAMEAPTDNIPSTGITFQHTSEDGNETAKAFVHETMKNTTLR